MMKWNGHVVSRECIEEPAGPADNGGRLLVLEVTDVCSSTFSSPIKCSLRSKI